MFHLPVYHTMLPPPSCHPSFTSCNLAKVSWRKWYRYNTRFMRDSLPFVSVFTEHIDSHQGAASFPSGLPSRRAHLLGVTGCMSPTPCLLWQVLIENQTLVVSSLNLKPSFCLSVTAQTWITLYTDVNHYILCHKKCTMKIKILINVVCITCQM